MTNLALNKFIYLLLYPLSLVLLIQEQLTVTFVLILPPMSCPTTLTAGQSNCNCHWSTAHVLHNRPSVIG